MKSWRTSIWGALAIAAGTVVAADFGDPIVTKIAGCVASAASGIGLLFARDQKQSEIENKENTKP